MHETEAQRGLFFVVSLYTISKSLFRSSSSPPSLSGLIWCYRTSHICSNTFIEMSSHIPEVKENFPQPFCSSSTCGKGSTVIINTTMSHSRRLQFCYKSVKEQLASSCENNPFYVKVRRNDMFYDVVKIEQTSLEIAPHKETFSTLKRHSESQTKNKFRWDKSEENWPNGHYYARQLIEIPTVA